jgi:hypothetical protein
LFEKSDIPEILVTAQNGGVYLLSKSSDISSPFRPATAGTNKSNPKPQADDSFHSSYDTNVSSDSPENLYVKYN